MSLRTRRRTTIAGGASTALVAGALVATGMAFTADGAHAVSPTQATTVAAARAANATGHVSAADLTWQASSVIAVTLNGTGATSTGNGITSSGGVVTITKAGTYRLTGSLTDGQVVVSTKDSGIVRLVLAGVTLRSSTGAALVIDDADEALVWTEAGTRNTLDDATRYVYPDAETTEPDAALFSKADLTLGGSGELVVHGNAGDAIGAKDGLAIAGGTITVTAADDGIRGKDYLFLTGGTVAVTAQGDGLKSANDKDLDKGFVDVSGGALTVTSAGDAVTAVTDVIVSGGTLRLTTGGGHTKPPSETVSAKGLKAGVVVLGGGTFVIDASDDAVNADTDISVTDGTFTISTGDDVLHSDLAVTVAGGTLDVATCDEGFEGITVTVSGGNTRMFAIDDGIGGRDKSFNEFADATTVLVTISGGTFVVETAGGDGVDSNGTLRITGGTVVVNGPTAMNNSAIDANGEYTISGGTVVALGSNGMVQNPIAASPQGWVSFRQNVAAGTVLHVTDASGTRLGSFKALLTTGAAFFSSSSVTSGQSYQLWTGGSVSGTAIGTLYSGGSLSGATSLASVVAGVGAGGGFPPWPTGGWPTRPSVTPTTTTTTAVPTSTTTTTTSSPTTTTTSPTKTKTRTKTKTTKKKTTKKPTTTKKKTTKKKTTR